MNRDRSKKRHYRIQIHKSQHVRIFWSSACTTAHRPNPYTTRKKSISDVTFLAHLVALCLFSVFFDQHRVVVFFFSLQTLFFLSSLLVCLISISILHIYFLTIRAIFNWTILLARMILGWCFFCSWIFRLKFKWIYAKVLVVGMWVGLAYVCYVSNRCNKFATSVMFVPSWLFTKDIDDWSQMSKEWNIIGMK